MLITDERIREAEAQADAAAQDAQTAASRASAGRITYEHARELERQARTAVERVAELRARQPGQRVAVAARSAKEHAGALTLSVEKTACRAAKTTAVADVAVAIEALRIALRSHRACNERVGSAIEAVAGLGLYLDDIDPDINHATGAGVRLVRIDGESFPQVDDIGLVAWIAAAAQREEFGPGAPHTSYRNAALDALYAAALPSPPEEPAESISEPVEQPEPTDEPYLVRAERERLAS